MCGIAGIVGRPDDLSISGRLDAMHARQRHRGPDDEGLWLGRTGDSAVGLAHERLAILDLSPGGHQPMVTDDGRHVLVFNGEIYNYRELRVELEANGVRFKSSSDTEVLLHALAEWGATALSRLNGMWAIAWLDRVSRRLVLARDRFGVKPLYLYESGGRHYFSSEIKAILAGSRDRFRVRPEVASRYLRQSLLAAQPSTFFDGIALLPAGTYVSFDLDQPSMPEPVPYWTLSRTDTLAGRTVAERVLALRELLTDAVRIRLWSDVPVGVLLSGGLDSSSIATLMQRVLGKDANLHLISAVSDDRRYDEQPFIDTMTDYLGCKSHKVNLRFSPDEAFRLLDEVTDANDEPLHSFTAVAHYLLMKHARELGITVILSGQGADELLCGYKKYSIFQLQSLLRQREWAKLTRTFVDLARRSTLFPQISYAEAKRYLPRYAHGTAPLGHRLRASEGVLDVGLGGQSVIERQVADVYHLSIPSLVQYEDRMSMAFAREIRLPFLDYRVVSMLIPTPMDLKIREGWPKWILRKAMEPFLPPTVAWRRDKMGFANPQSVWLRRDLRPKVERMFRQPMLTADLGLIDQTRLGSLYTTYCGQTSGGSVDYREIWNPLALEVWARRYESSLAPL